MIKKIILAALFVLSTQIYAEYSGTEYSGVKMMSDCEAEPGSMQDGACIGFVRGATEVYKFYDGCIPKDIPLQQSRDIALAFMKDHPEGRFMPAAFLAVVAWGEAFACEEDN